MRRFAPVVVAVLFAVLAAWWVARPSTDAPPPTAATATTKAPAPPRREVRIPKPKLPRPSVPPAVPVPAPAPEPDAPASAASADGDRVATTPDGSANAPVDRREHPSADSAALGEAIKTRMAAITPEILHCLVRGDGPRFEGSLVIRFQVEADGLQDAWVEDVDSIPDEVLPCFSDAVYGPDWSGLTQEPIEVTRGFEVSVE